MVTWTDIYIQVRSVEADDRRVGRRPKSGKVWIIPTSTCQRRFSALGAVGDGGQSSGDDVWVYS